jgi:LysR family transcriptional activator of nhaA
MKSKNLNFRHLYYFWVVAKEGGVSRAAERLGVAVQTVSMQVSQLEQNIGKALLAPQGRRLVLTEAGQVALGYADQIFMLGEQLQESLEDDSLGNTMRLVVGISDSLPKLTAFRLMEAALTLPKRVRVACYDGKFESLLADLALHKFDVVLTDRPVNSVSSLRVFSHPLGECPVALYGVPELAERYTENFPGCLTGAPLLLPTRNNAVRSRLDQWFERHSIRPDILGEFEDSALLKTFGRHGMGLFPAPSALAMDIKEQFHSVQTGDILDINEQFFAISTELKIRHPAVEALLSAPFKLTPT